MKLATFLLTLTVLWPISNTHANVGVFTGYGYSIELASTKDVQMVSEEVTIIPGEVAFCLTVECPVWIELNTTALLF